MYYINFLGLSYPSYIKIRRTALPAIAETLILYAFPVKALSDRYYNATQNILSLFSMAKIGRFNASKYSYQALRYCSPPGVVMMPIAEWAAENFYSVRQCRTLLKNRVLVGMKFKGRMYVARNPDK